MQHILSGIHSPTVGPQNDQGLLHCFAKAGGHRCLIRGYVDSKWLSGRKCCRDLALVLGFSIFKWHWWSHSQRGSWLQHMGQHFSSSRGSERVHQALNRKYSFEIMAAQVPSKTCWEILWGLFVFRAAILNHLRSQAHWRVGTTGYIHVRVCVNFTGFALPSNPSLFPGWEVLL